MTNTESFEGGSLKLTPDQERGDSYLSSESSIGAEDFKGYCNTVEEFRKLESEIGVAARWTVPRKPEFAPDWESRWRWKPSDGQGWPKHGNDIF